MQLVHLQTVSVPDAPSQALFIGGHQLAMHGPNFSGRADRDATAVQRVATALHRSLGHADDNGHAVLARGFLHRFEISVFDVDPVGKVARVPSFLHRVVEGGAAGAFDPDRIAGHHDFAKDGELSTLAGRFT